MKLAFRPACFSIPNHFVEWRNTTKPFNPHLACSSHARNPNPALFLKRIYNRIYTLATKSGHTCEPAAIPRCCLTEPLGDSTHNPNIARKSNTHAQPQTPHGPNKYSHLGHEARPEPRVRPSLGLERLGRLRRGRADRGDVCDQVC